MLRLKSPGHDRLMQTPVLEATFGGGEANVAVSLANYGMDAAFVTVLPENDLAQACLRELRGFGVDTSRVVFGPGRVGIYFLETGSNQRPARSFMTGRTARSPRPCLAASTGTRPLPVPAGSIPRALRLPSAKARLI